MIEEQFDPDRTILMLEFRKNGEKIWRKKSDEKTLENYNAILKAMQPNIWYKATEFEDVVDVKESRMKVILDHLNVNKIINSYIAQNYLKYR